MARDFSATWNGRYPSFCSGTWSLTMNGVDISDKIPPELRTEPMNTEGTYFRRTLNHKGVEERSEYSHGLPMEAWIEANRYWLDKITQDPVELRELYNTFNYHDWRYCQCGGCL